MFERVLGLEQRTYRLFEHGVDKVRLSFPSMGLLEVLMAAHLLSCCLSVFSPQLNCTRISPLWAGIRDGLCAHFAPQFALSACMFVLSCRRTASLAMFCRLITHMPAPFFSSLYVPRDCCRCARVQTVRFAVLSRFLRGRGVQLRFCPFVLHDVYCFCF